MSIIVPVALLLLAIPLACAFHISPHARWMMDNTILRLLWYSSVLPLAFFAQGKSIREVYVAIIPMLILLALIPLVCAFYTSPYASWMMDNTIPRLMWYIFAIPLYELICDSK